MIATLLQFIQTALIPLGAWGVFLASFIEEVVAPIPSALVITLSGFVFLGGPLSWHTLWVLCMVVALPAACGVTVGSLFVYGIAYGFGKPVLVRWGKWLGLSWADVERLQKKFEVSTNDELALFILRTLPIVPSVAISAFFGLVRFDSKKYVLYSFLGTYIRALILGVVGWQVGTLYVAYADLISRFEKIVWVVLVGGLVAYIVYRLRTQKKGVI